MNAKRIGMSLLRRWYITVPALLLAAVLCLMSYNKTSPTYERTSSVVLIPGKGSVPVGGNPYYYLGGLSQATDVLVRSMNSKTVTGDILADYPNVTASVTRDLTTSGPVVVVTVDGVKDNDVARVLDAVVAAVPTTLNTLQNDAQVPAESRISSLTLTQDDAPKLIQKARYTTLGFIAVGSLVAVVLLVGLLDGLIGMLKRQRQEAKALKASLAAAGQQSRPSRVWSRSRAGGGDHGRHHDEPSGREDAV